MADKEERFVIVKVSNYCGKCEALGSVECKNNPINKSGRACKVGMTRAEAVERMALALFNKERKYCSPKECQEYGGVGETCEGCKLWEKYEHLAEAALDALLGDKK